VILYVKKRTVLKVDHLQLLRVIGDFKCISFTAVRIQSEVLIPFAHQWMNRGMDTIVVGSDRHSLGHGKGRWCGCQHVLNNCVFGISIHGYRVNELWMIYQPQLLSLTEHLVVCYVSVAVQKGASAWKAK
jgi:hypothetical protein